MLLVASILAFQGASDRVPAQFVVTQIKAPTQHPNLADWVLTENGSVVGTWFMTPEEGFYAYVSDATSSRMLSTQPGSQSMVLAASTDFVLGAIRGETVAQTTTWIRAKSGAWSVSSAFSEEALSKPLAEARWISRGFFAHQVRGIESVFPRDESFMIVGVGRDGWVYGTKSDVLKFKDHIELKDKVATRWRNGVWESLHPRGAIKSSIEAVSAEGVAVGIVKTEEHWIACAWRNAKAHFAENSSDRYNAINSRGDIVGFRWMRDANPPCAWIGGRYVDLHGIVKSDRDPEPIAINDRRQILMKVRAETGDKLYLLTPQSAHTPRR